MENGNKYRELKEQGITDFGLVGRLLNIGAVRIPLKEGHVYTKEEVWKLDDYQSKAAKKNTEIDDKSTLALETGVKQ